MLTGNIKEEDERKYSGSILFLGIGIWPGFWKADRICKTKMQRRVFPQKGMTSAKHNNQKGKERLVKGLLDWVGWDRGIH